MDITKNTATVCILMSRLGAYYVLLLGKDKVRYSDESNYISLPDEEADISNKLWEIPSCSISNDKDVVTQVNEMLREKLNIAYDMDLNHLPYDRENNCYYFSTDAIPMELSPSTDKKGWFLLDELVAMCLHGEIQNENFKEILLEINRTTQQ